MSTKSLPPMDAPRDYSVAEDRANTASAALSLLVVAGGIPFLLNAARENGTIPGTLIFTISALVLYLASTLYHALPPGKTRSIARVIDHSTIFILIAGTYTPFTLGPLREHHGLILLASEWSLALLGILFKAAGGMRFRRLSTAIYAGMGWLGIFWMPAFIREVSWSGFAWLLAGGLFYTGGLIFYNAKGKPFTHLIWHLFVLAGTLCHGYAVWRYA